MDNEFMLGVNYWSSNAGIKMWSEFDIDVINDDFSLLRQSGVNTIRIFPVWDVFQPLAKLYTFENEFQSYAYEYDTALPFNDAGNACIDCIMIERFKEVLKLAQKHSIKVIVGLITGWMSGRLFTPRGLEGKNLITDPECIRIEIKYVQYLVNAFKNFEIIVAWDFGNECNCLQSNISENEAFVWGSCIYNAIYKIDNTRPVISGMHSSVNDTGFSIKVLAETTDILCTHPYPYFSQNSLNGNSLSFRILMNSSCSTSMNSDLSGKPTLVEEIGTLGPMFCSDDIAGKFASMNMFETLSQGFSGLLWWCAFDKHHLNYPPYDWFILETELGIMCCQKKSKPIATAMKEFAKIINKHNLKSLPEATKKAVCLLTKGTNKWNVGYGTYMLARQAGFNIKFCDSNSEIPNSELYMIPSISGHESITKSQFMEIMNRVRNEGANLYISLDKRAFLPHLSKMCGIEVQTVSERVTDHEMLFKDEKISLSSDYQYYCKTTTATVLAKSANNELMFVNKYGKGQVFTLLLPIERIVAESHDFISDEDADNYFMLYNAFEIDKNVSKSYKNISLNEQKIDDRILVTAINAGRDVLETFELRNGYKLDDIILGDTCKSNENTIQFILKQSETVMFFIKKE